MNLLRKIKCWFGWHKIELVSYDHCIDSYHYLFSTFDLIGYDKRLKAYQSEPLIWERCKYCGRRL